MGLAKGWDKESADLFIHETGARISRTSYRGKLAWWFFPVSLDVPAVEHAATDEGREEAFATSEKQLPKTRSKSKTSPKKKAVAAAEEEGEPNPDKEEAEDDDKDEDGE
jgi:hypothetical protein